MLWLSIKEIQIYPQKIIIIKGRRKHEYKWSEIKDACVKKAKRILPIPSAYGRNEKLFVLRTDDRTFTFEISGHSPDFENSTELIAELKKYLV